MLRSTSRTFHVTGIIRNKIIIVGVTVRGRMYMEIENLEMLDKDKCTNEGRGAARH